MYIKYIFKCTKSNFSRYAYFFFTHPECLEDKGQTCAIN